MTDEKEPTTVEKLYMGVQLTRPLLRNITARVEADLEGTGVSVGQRAILDVLLLRGRATAPEITQILQLKRQFVGRELKELIKIGMVQAELNPMHKTARIHRLTPMATKIIQEIRQRETESFTEFASRFTADEIDGFYRIQMALNEEMVKSWK